MQQLNESLTAEGYSNIRTKIQRLIRDKKLTPVTRGIYETNTDIPGYLLASTIYSPSYISFEYALSWHNLIPERVNVYTCATFNKKRQNYIKLLLAYLLTAIFRLELTHTKLNYVLKTVTATNWPRQKKRCVTNFISCRL